jgi:multidrug efflux pump subunit AcrA (membrane-fusion protein)
VTRNGFAATGILVSLAAISVSISGCGGGSDSSITKAPVAYGAVTEIVEAPASVTPKAQVTVTAPAAGTVAELLVADGQPVTAGQPLLRLDSPAAQGQLAAAKQADAQAAASTQSSSSGSTIDFSRSLSQADTQAKQAFDGARATADQIADPALKATILDQIAAARTDYAAAGADVRSTIGNFNRGIATASDVLDSLTQAQRTQTKAAVAIAQQTVDSLTVRAPIAGALSLRSGSGGSAASGVDVSSLLSQLGGGALGPQLSSLAGLSGASGPSGGAASTGSDTVIAVGSPVSSGAPLLVLTDASTLTLTAQVDETSILKIAAGVPADVQLDAIAGAAYQGSVLSVDSQGQAASRGGVNYRVRLSLGAGKLGDGSAAPVPRPGMSAVVDLKVASKDHVLAVPSAAVVHEGNQDTVWRLTSGVAHRQVIRLGAQGDQVVEVAAGLAEGDMIVIAGADKVHDGQKL